MVDDTQACWECKDTGRSCPLFKLIFGYTVSTMATALTGKHLPMNICQKSLITCVLRHFITSHVMWVITPLIWRYKESEKAMYCEEVFGLNWDWKINNKSFLLSQADLFPTTVVSVLWTNNSSSLRNYLAVDLRNILQIWR